MKKKNKRLTKQGRQTAATSAGVSTAAANSAQIISAVPAIGSGEPHKLTDAEREAEWQEHVATRGQQQ